MESNYSLSDLKAVTDGAGELGGGSWWLIIILLFFFIGGNGFGRDSFSQYATASSQDQILFGQRFGDLQTSINKVGDGLSSLGYAQLQQMDANTASINNNITTEGRALQMQICQLNSNIDNKFAQLERTQLEQTIANQQAQINQLSLAQQMANVVKYPTTSAYCSGSNPFCGCGCGCAN